LTALVVAIDAMGGDFGPSCTVPASLLALDEHPGLELLLVGQASSIEACLPPNLDKARRNRLQVIPANEVISMDEAPAAALRGKPDSSMRRALQCVRDGDAHACVSAGNSGALLALSRHLLKTLPGIARPPMIRAIPTAQGTCLLLDLGANLDCPAAQLCQFALLGALAAEARGAVQPKVALLNVGSEAIKGNQQVKQADALLREAKKQGKLHYIGYIEGHDLFAGKADVAVCDGFVGNLLLKSSEGLAQMLNLRLRREFARTGFSRLIGALALPLLRRLKKELNPAQHNGASFLGLRQVVVKSHGGADAEGFKNAILHAQQELACNLVQHLQSRLARLYPDRPI